ncbi:MAG: hypothetical protein JWM55_1323 [Acidimicrobiaceae bacterium]|nr:hypothetical protein [Acidimicrobiaceae bacterium]
MSQLSQLSQALIDEISVRRPTIDELRTRTHRRHVRRRSLAAASLALAVGVAAVVASFGTTSITPTKPNKLQLVSYYQAAINVSNSTLETVGLPATVAIPTRVNPTLPTAGTNGVVSYVGAEYCPYCAIQRWGLLVALSKFGTFINLNNEIFSSSSDAYPHLASWSFVGAKYASEYFRFEPVELTSNKPISGGGHEPLEKMSEAQRVAYDKFNPQGELPFVDFGNHFVTLGASSSPAVLEGLSLSAIGQQLKNPKSAVALAVDGSANYFIASLCSMAQTDAPAICSSRVTLQAMKDLRRGERSPQTRSGGTTAPVQPPTSAPLSVWRKWSAEDRKFLLAAAADYRYPNSTCTVLKISVTPNKSNQTVLGVPAGVTRWGISIEGKCRPGQN